MEEHPLDRPWWRLLNTISVLLFSWAAPRAHVHADAESSLPPLPAADKVSQALARFSSIESQTPRTPGVAYNYTGAVLRFGAWRFLCMTLLSSSEAAIMLLQIWLMSKIFKLLEDEAYGRPATMYDAYMYATAFTGTSLGYALCFPVTPVN